MIEQTTRYGMSTTVDMPYETAVERIRATLKEQGFGVLTEIDVRATLKQKLDVDFKPYVILGACNPPLAHRALQTEEEIGLLLPCNVVVYEGEEPGRTVIGAMDPVAALGLSGNDQLESVAEDVKRRLTAALESVVEASAKAG